MKRSRYFLNEETPLSSVEAPATPPPLDCSAKAVHATSPPAKSAFSLLNAPLSTLPSSRLPPLSREEADALLPRETAFIVADTETTCLSERAQVVQIAYAACDGEGNQLRLMNQLLRPRIRIAAAARRVHGIDYATARDKGICPMRGLRRFLRVCAAARMRELPIVFHNAAFDVRVIDTTLRAGGEREHALQREECLCTMRRAATHVLCRSSETGRKRPPSNVELYSALHKGAPPPEGKLHDASHDILITGLNFAKGRRRGWW